jgi:hypothetical protein
VGQKPDSPWDHDIDDSQLRKILAGELRIGRLDRDWAAVRLVEYALYAGIVAPGLEEPGGALALRAVTSSI